VSSFSARREPVRCMSRSRMAMPTERTEAILAGLVAALEFFDCVPRELWWDIGRTAMSWHPQDSAGAPARAPIGDIGVQ